MVKKLLYRDSDKGLHASPSKESIASADPESVSVTDAAWDEIRRQWKKEEPTPKAIRVGLRGGGCSGYTYAFEWDHKNSRSKDIVLQQEIDDVRFLIYIDHKSMKLLKGTTLDYHRSMMSQGFKFHNPNSTGSCGCGESTSF